MAETATLTPEEDGGIQTPLGPEGEPTPEKTSPEGDGLEPAVDYKEKFKFASQEALRIREEKERLELENDDLKVKLADRASETLSDEDLSRKYPDWDIKSEDEKISLKRADILERKLAKIEEQTKWSEEFSEAIDNYPQLAKSKKEFKDYAYKPENRKIPLSVLAKSFLFDNKDYMEKETEPIVPRRGLERPVGGTKFEPAPQYSYEDMKKLRTTNSRRYQQLLKAGKFDKLLK